jgi:transposase
MLSLPPSVRIFLAREPVDCRKAFDGLCALVRDQFGDDPFSGHLFAFFNKRRDRVKILVWDKNGFWLFAKRLERGTFEPITMQSESRHRVEVERARLLMLLEGIDQRKAIVRKHFEQPLRLSARDVGARRTSSERR